MEKKIICIIENGKVRMTECGNDYDGSYILVNNVDGGFSLYDRETFGKFEKNIMEIGGKNGENEFRSFVRWVFSGAVEIDVDRSSFVLPKKNIARLNNKISAAYVYPGHIRFVGALADGDSEIAEDIIEKGIERIIHQ